MRILALTLLLVLTIGAPSRGAVEILLPQNRTAFQTNEWIDISVVRSSDDALAAGDLVLTLDGDDGSQLAFTLPVAGGGKTKTEHLHVNAWLMLPGKYSVDVAVDGQATDQATRPTIEVYSHVRQSSFRLINWGRADRREQQLPQGEDSFGYNLFYGGYARDDEGHFIRAGVDFMANCVMSGGHQMDLRTECDWSDPLVTRGGTRRVVRRAMFDRTRPNVPGVHFYDEPGLTWHKHPVTGECGPHGVPSQRASFKAAFDRDAPEYHQVDSKNAADVARWKHLALWKLGLMDAAWKEAQFGVSRVRPDFLSVTQSQYGWTAFTDGYYFNVARSLPVTSGHGGYHDYGLGIFNPSYFLEMSRARDRGKPCWYLPTWYGNTTADQFRLEQYLSFQTNIQGMITPPDCEPARNAGPRQGIVESNHLMKKLGTIFTTMPPTKPPVALLYSLSQCIQAQSKDRSQNYAHAIPHGKNLPLAYLAGKLIQHQFFSVLDEDVIDGTLAAGHRAVVLTTIDYLDPSVVTALEEFAANGGLVLLTADCTVEIKGAKKVTVAPRLPDQAKYDELAADGNWQAAAQYATIGLQMKGALPLGRAIDAELRAAGIMPVFECDQPTITATRQAEGDIEYLFAVNATPDAAAKNDQGEVLNNQLRAAAATIDLPNDGRPVYDPLLTETHFTPRSDEGPVFGGLQLGSGQRVEGSNRFDERPKQGRLVQKFRFGPGQMRVFARTAKPIGGVQIATPIVTTDLVRHESPIRLHLAFTLTDTEGGILAGSAPMHIQIIDPQGHTRFDLYRATKLGQFSIELPLAANDATGEWKVRVAELLSGLDSEATFRFTPPRRARSLAGATWRAVVTANDQANAFRFARTHHDVTLVAGTSDFNRAAVDRLTKILAPWGVRCKTMPLEKAAKPRTLTEDEARTWVGLQYAGSGQIKPGSGNAPVFAGFAVQGPVILLGNPADNPLIEFLQKEKFLPYQTDAVKFPGVGRGMLAWQRDGIGAGQESVTLIAYDAAGMNEAVGSFYEAVAGIEPLTKYRWPKSDAIKAGRIANPSRDDLEFDEIAHVPDRVVGLKLNGGKLTALSHDGTLVTIGFQGQFNEQQTTVVADSDFAKQLSQLKTAVDAAANSAAQEQSTTTRLVKFVVPFGDQSAVVFWGGGIEVRDKTGKPTAAGQLPQDVTAAAADDQTLIVGLANGRIMIVK